MILGRRMTNDRTDILQHGLALPRRLGAGDGPARPARRELRGALKDAVPGRIAAIEFRQRLAASGRGSPHPSLPPAA
ncbi:hypothetical protein [Paracraurococcus lichenis]|uniref:Uncharacterized protein n=1 Tax=Paracraurococcus lichenis TaxID=3064888 RepID=A0ABT9E6X7_9PROT|nr:hypothetical protein [Paracraurococcus sp. LOR1-02]MDO9711934.1 hypothetical protein [Paracraurococcus sp. LOR1-02]